MQSNTRRDTKPELRLRRQLHASGLRYRVDFPPIPGVRRRADVVFTRWRIAVFVDGCYWHGCPEHGAKKFGTNAQFWADKISTNRARDADTDARLEAAGWCVLRVWEHEDPSVAARRVEAALRGAAARHLGQPVSAD